MTGRSFLADADSIGRRGDGKCGWTRAPAPCWRHRRRICAPARPRRSRIHGIGLDGDVSLGEGVTIEEVVARDAETVVVRASADADAASGARTVSVGDADADGLLTVYRRSTS